MLRVAPHPAPANINRVALPLAAGTTYPEARVRCRPVDGAGRAHVAVIRYRDGAIDRVLGTGDTTGADWQDVRIVAPIALATPNDVVMVVITGAAEVGVIELEPPAPTRAPRLWTIVDGALASVGL